MAISECGFRIADLGDDAIYLFRSPKSAFCNRWARPLPQAVLTRPPAMACGVK